MKTALIAYSRKGQLTALKIAALLKEDNVSAFCPERILDEGFQPIARPFNSFYGELFNSCDVLIFVGSTGIAVREIAPHVKSKTTDPAVISIDELGRFVIALLSGHIGGANAFALKLAEALGSTPVITTATDINGRFSVDAWAARQGLVIDNMKICKDISALILEKDLPLKSALPIKGSLPSGVFEGEEGELGIYIGTDIQAPFKETLRLVPKTLSVGIGCRKGISEELINEAVNKVFEENHLDKRAIKGIYSIDIKSEEAGLLAFCKGL
ncbi:MAG: cobalamin biosynthesis protein, partial [Parasporobacterium sp.]|nr:cobalamin biosynthesis protein [Parasporobacterium sp.]